MIIKKLNFDKRRCYDTMNSQYFTQIWSNTKLPKFLEKIENSFLKSNFFFDQNLQVKKSQKWKFYLQLNNTN
ncbi:hypothetical protein BpHYR1_053491 [Brachionus plicatilis]|uniref:Uncharacterized protein n=1 Tax=Brachionus plicatilis TaxID=10195 RepID=A0A3M7R3P8_BRAPC|nr:hypothetical protein BpHYR1_053491 [Brachionus plicatilis]